MLMNWQLTIVFPIEQIGELSKQTIVMVDSDKNQLAIDFLWENVKLLESITVWDTVECEYVTRINVTNRVFNRITGKSISKYNVEAN
jgi:hypothetical protein